jgi:hypothetical protein
MVWTSFWDMHSGGGQKDTFAKAYIEAEREQAIAVFYRRFGHNPERVTCSCCGPDYSIDEHLTLEQATAYHRNCDSAWFYTDTDEEIVQPKGNKDTFWRPAGLVWDGATQTLDGRPVDNRYVERQGRGAMLSQNRSYMTVEQYRLDPDVLVIDAEDISEDEKRTHVPRSGYVWVED